MVNGNAAGQNFQMLVVSDLEFVGLQRHPSYKHEARSIEGVATELSGTLRREGHDAAIISESAVEARKKRYERIHAKSEALLAARLGQSDGCRSDSSPDPSLQSASVEQVLELPPATPDAPKPSSVASSEAIHQAVACDAEHAQANQGARPGMAEQAWRDL